MTKFAVKCCLSTEKGSGAKLVVNNRGEPRVFTTIASAEKLLDKCERSKSITGVTEQFFVVQADKPGWISGVIHV